MYRLVHSRRGEYGRLHPEGEAAHGADGDRRAQLVDAAVDHVAAYGIADLSLRRLGAAIDVSHRMLIHYFGSKEQLLVEIVRASERRQRDLLSRLRLTPGLSPADVARLLWQQLTDPRLAGQERLFFEIYGRALRGRPEAVPILEGLVADWLEPLVAAEVAAGQTLSWPGTARGWDSPPSAVCCSTCSPPVTASASTRRWTSSSGCTTPRSDALADQAATAIRLEAHSMPGPPAVPDPRSAAGGGTQGGGGSGPQLSPTPPRAGRSADRDHHLAPAVAAAEAGSYTAEYVPRPDTEASP